MEDSQLPSEFERFISEKLQKNSQGGRPHFIRMLAGERDPQEQVLDIAEAAWLKDRTIGSLARKYRTSYVSIWRLLQNLNPWKQQLVAYLQQFPRRKIFYNRDANTSDYETVHIYIKTSKRDGIKNYKANIILAAKCWLFLKYKDPSNWTAEDVQGFLSELKEGSQSRYLDCIRRIAPQIADRNSQDYLRTSKYREKLALRKKDLFGPEVQMIIKALRHYGLAFQELIFKLHVTSAAREGKDGKSGITGLTWERFKRDFTAVDLYESKVRGGIWWRDCPLALFFTELPKALKDLWISRNRPVGEKLLRNGYPELIRIYREIRECLGKYYQAGTDPSLFKELTTLRPHDADKIHVNMLWEAEVPLEVVAGKYLGRGEGIGLMGRGWLDINTIKKHYLSLTERSERIQNLRRQVQAYSGRFNAGPLSADQLPSETYCLTVTMDSQKPSS